MSRRRNLPRASKVAMPNAIFSDSDASSDLSEDDLNLLEIFEAILQDNSKSRTSRRVAKKPTKKRPRQNNSSRDQSTLAKKSKKSQENVATGSNGFVCLDSEEDNIDKVVTENHTKKIESKVDSFFKSRNLVSDDDEDEIILPKSSVQAVPKQKEFYTLSDSDEEIDKLVKSTTVKDSPISVQGPSSSKSLPEESVSKNDELMDIVDKILDCDDSTIEIPHNEPDQSWSDYKNKAEEILGNINTLLQEIKEDTKPPEQPKLIVPSPEKTQQMCPICLEKLGGEVLSMSTICGHIFCKKCITKVVATSKHCPTCRKKVTRKKIHAVYL